MHFVIELKSTRTPKSPLTNKMQKTFSGNSVLYPGGGPEEEGSPRSHAGCVKGAPGNTNSQGTPNTLTLMGLKANTGFLRYSFTRQ